MQETKKINPLIAIAAVSVILFSIVGIGVMTGLIPNHSSRNNETALVTPEPKAEIKIESVSKVEDDSHKTKADVAPAPKQKAAPTHSTGTPVKPATQPAVQADATPPEQAKPAPVCTSCGVVTGVNAVKQQGEGSGLGAVAGGVVGGLLGNQVGGGTGKKIATVAGAAGGAFAGHQVEKTMKSSTRYDVTVKMEDGTVRTFPYDSQPAFQTGSKVRVVNGALTTD
jgi:outer membrane lipoprotein SlyB